MSGDYKPLWAPQPSVEEQKRMYDEWLESQKKVDQTRTKDESRRVIIIDI